MARVRKEACPEDTVSCERKECDFYIADIRFKNCSLRVDKEMSIDEIVTATGWDRKMILALLKSALKKIKVLLKENTEEVA